MLFLVKPTFPYENVLDSTKKWDYKDLDHCAKNGFVTPYNIKSEKTYAHT